MIRTHTVVAGETLSALDVRLKSKPPRALPPRSRCAQPDMLITGGGGTPTPCTMRFIRPQAEVEDVENANVRYRRRKWGGWSPGGWANRDSQNYSATNWSLSTKTRPPASSTTAHLRAGSTMRSPISTACPTISPKSSTTVMPPHPALRSSKRRARPGAGACKAIVLAMTLVKHWSSIGIGDLGADLMHGKCATGEDRHH